MHRLILALSLFLTLVVGATVALDAKRVQSLQADPAPVVKKINKIVAWNRVYRPLTRQVQQPIQQPRR